MQFDRSDTALVVIDPQNDVLSETGASWGLVSASVRANDTIEDLAIHAVDGPVSRDAHAGGNQSTASCRSAQ